jgi:hypothetical protein
MGFRYQESFRHFIGTVEQKQREILGTQIRNTYALFDFGLSRQLTPRWSVNTSVPLLFANRNQLYNPRGIYDVRSIGDMTVGGRMNVWRPSNERFTNVTLGFSLKLPTGEYKSTGVAVDAAGKQVIATADQSIQAGDGRVGFAMDIQAFHRVWYDSMLYLSGSYLFNPADTNGVYTYRGRASERYMSVTDQYLWRAGVARAIPGVRGLTATFGGRIEGVPVRDAFGKSNGFRRPGYAISVDPGLMFSRGDMTYSGNFAWAVERNRRRSVPDIAEGRHGDAAFADWTVNFGISRRF